MRHRFLTTLLRWLAVAVILRVQFAILTNYPDYFPPNFDSLFLQGREAAFHGLYRGAFYVHILSAPFVLLNGLFLLWYRFGPWHRWLGRVQVAVLLTLMLPSGVVMARQAYAGWLAGLSFFTLSATTAICAIVGVYHARQRRIDRHPRWMLRTYVLICSAIALRLLSGAASLLEVQEPELAYVIAAWCSWLLPLAGYEIVDRSSRRVT